MLPIIAIIGGGIARLLSFSVIQFVAMKLMLLTLFTVIVPVILYNVFTRILQEYMDFIADKMNSEGLQGQVIALTGFGGWIAEQIQLPLALTIFLSAVMLRFILNIVRR